MVCFPLRTKGFVVGVVARSPPGGGVVLAYFFRDVWDEPPPLREVRAFTVSGSVQRDGDVAREALVVLLTHERPDVRVMAAAFLLRYRTTDAMEVLREAAKGSGLVAFEASEAMKRWEEGTWALDPA